MSITSFIMTLLVVSSVLGATKTFTSPLTIDSVKCDSDSILVSLIEKKTKRGDIVFYKVDLKTIRNLNFNRWPDTIDSYQLDIQFYDIDGLSLYHDGPYHHTLQPCWNTYDGECEKFKTDTGWHFKGFVFGSCFLQPINLIASINVKLLIVKAEH